MNFISVAAILVLCAVFVSTDAVSLRKRRAVFAYTSYTGQKAGRNDLYNKLFGRNKLTDPSAKPVVAAQDAPTPRAEVTDRQDAACSITYDADCVPEHLAILPLNIRSRTICGPGWVCYEK